MRKWVKFINHESQSDIRKWVLRDYGNIFSLFLFLNTKDNITHLEKKGNLQNLRSIYHVILWHSSPWEDVEWWPFLTGWTLSFMVTILNLFSGWQGSRHPTRQNTSKIELTKRAPCKINLHSSGGSIAGQQGKGGTHQEIHTVLCTFFCTWPIS